MKMWTRLNSFWVQFTLALIGAVWIIVHLFQGIGS
jgi:hypothetical protein